MAIGEGTSREQQLVMLKTFVETVPSEAALVNPGAGAGTGGGLHPALLPAGVSQSMRGNLSSTGSDPDGSDGPSATIPTDVAIQDTLVDAFLQTNDQRANGAVSAAFIRERVGVLVRHMNKAGRAGYFDAGQGHLSTRRKSFVSRMIHSVATDACNAQAGVHGDGTQVGFMTEDKVPIDDQEVERRQKDAILQASSKLAIMMGNDGAKEMKQTIDSTIQEFFNQQRSKLQ